VDRDGHLAVGLLAERPAILPLDPDRVLPLLGEGHVVDQEHALGAGERPGQRRPVPAQDRSFVPRALVDELLEGLLGVLAGQPGREGDAAGQRLDTLAVAVEQEPLEVDAGPGGRLGLGEVVGKQGGVVSEAVEDRRIEIRGISLHTR
jgi:hypothetical protein